MESEEDYDYSSKIKIRKIDPLVRHQNQIQFASLLYMNKALL